MVSTIKENPLKGLAYQQCNSVEIMQLFQFSTWLFDCSALVRVHDLIRASLSHCVTVLFLSQ